jgi:hypothetical protein
MKMRRRHGSIELCFFLLSGEDFPTHGNIIIYNVVNYGCNLTDGAN